MASNTFTIVHSEPQHNPLRGKQHVVDPGATPQLCKALQTCLDQNLNPQKDPEKGLAGQGFALNCQPAQQMN